MNQQLKDGMKDIDDLESEYNQLEMEIKDLTEILIALKSSKVDRPVKNKDAAVFDHCRLRNIYVTLNAERYPAVDYNAAFNENRIARVFKEAYMDSLLSNGGINPSDFIDLYPLFVIDVSHQSERLKESTVDIQIRAEFARNVPANTEASALIISDRILQFQSDGLCSSCFIILNGKYNEEQIELENVSPDCIDKEDVESLDQEASYSLRPRTQKGDHHSELFDMDQSQSTIEDFDSQVSNWSDALSKPSIESLNEALQILGKGSISPLKSQLKTPIEDASSRTVRLYKRKAVQGIDALIECIAPGQSSKLFKHITSQVSNNEDTDSQLTQMIVKLYNSSDKNNEKLQLLSMIANKYSKTQLQNLIPGLTVWRIDQARRHFQFYSNGPGSFSVDAKEKLHRLRMDPVSSFGMRTVKLEQETVSIPQVIRTSCNSELVNMYITICKEQDFSPLSSSTLFKILSSCSAAKKTNLRGLDNIAADGNTAFDLLINVTKELVNMEVLDRDDSDEILSKLKKSKIYLKTDYKLHVQKNDRCADHCINWALSDTKEKEYAVECDHLHDLVCDRCNLLPDVLQMLIDRVNNTSELTNEEKEEHLRDLEACSYKIELWKAHLLKTVNQDEARTKIFDDLNENSAVIVIDWAMKFLPALHREKMTDFFGQKGLSWHVAVAIFKDCDQNLKHNTFVHCFHSVKQDWFTVASIMEHLISHMKSVIPSLKEVSVRSDNAGCYHCGHFWLSLNGISERTVSENTTSAIRSLTTWLQLYECACSCVEDIIMYILY
ncbi:unnamed protein product [Mytilus edulis]|uniref:Double jelly roll-like domain-containing protein n=1 Tax=Mytilus edulis TaxID=6550 RepID=A0A8S3U7X5_MYTED|nr:unnamed protein product [Mytilus edulis]